MSHHTTMYCACLRHWQKFPVGAAGLCRSAIGCNELAISLKIGGGRESLRDILLCVLLMPFWGKWSLLQLDVHLRNPQLLRLFRCAGSKRVVVSDTTIARVLKWLAPADSRRALLDPLETLESEHLLTRSLVPNGRARRLGVFDGSQMGSHYLVAALLCGKINYPLLAEPCPGRGHELKTTQHWLPWLHRQLGTSAPELWLLDAHYFNHSSFQTVRTLDAHVLIKYTPHGDPAETKLFRDVLDDDRGLFVPQVRSRLPRFHTRIAIQFLHGF